MNSASCRVLSPTRRKEPPSKLTVLDNDNADQVITKDWGASKSKTISGHLQKQVNDEGDKGDLVVLTSVSKKRVSSGREEKRLVTARRIDHSCSANEDTHEVADIAKKVESLSMKEKNKSRDTVCSSLPPSNRSMSHVTPLEGTGLKGMSKPRAAASTSSNQSSVNNSTATKQEKAQEKVQEKTVPLDLLSSFLAALMDKNYPDAKELCRKILQIDPNHSICKDFLPSIDDMMTEIDVQTKNEATEGVSELSSSEDDDSSEEDDEEDEGETDEEDEEDEESDESDVETNDVLTLNLLMGGVPVRKSSS